MRTVVIALSIVTLMVGVWLTTKNPENAEPALDRMRSAIAPIAVAPEDDSGIVTGSAPATVASDNRAANGDPRIEMTRPAMRNPYYEPAFRDALRDALLGYLVESGLSALDSERIVDAAIGGLTECAVTSSRFDAEGRTALRTCSRNVMQEIGLNEAIRQTALTAATRHLARSLALERSARE